MFYATYVSILNLNILLKYLFASVSKWDIESSKISRTEMMGIKDNFLYYNNRKCCVQLIDLYISSFCISLKKPYMSIHLSAS